MKKFVEEIREIRENEDLASQLITMSAQNLNGENTILESIKLNIIANEQMGFNDLIISRKNYEMRDEIRWLKENDFKVEITDSKRFPSDKYSQIIISWSEDNED